MNDHFGYWTPLREKKKLSSYALRRRLVRTRLSSCSADQLIIIEVPVDIRAVADSALPKWNVLSVGDCMSCMCLKSRGQG
jgi:hypothetical protein